MKKIISIFIFLLLAKFTTEIVISSTIATIFTHFKLNSNLLFSSFVENKYPNIKNGIPTVNQFLYIAEFSLSFSDKFPLYATIFNI